MRDSAPHQLINDEDIPKYYIYPLEITFEFLTFSKREKDNIVGRNVDGDGETRMGNHLLNFFTRLRYSYLSMS